MTSVLDPYFLFFPGMPQVSFKSHSLYFWLDFVGCWPRQVLACTGFSQPALPLGSNSPLICLSPRQQLGGGGDSFSISGSFLPTTLPSSSRPACNFLSHFQKLLGLPSLSVSSERGGRNGASSHLLELRWAARALVLPAGRFLLPCGGDRVLFWESLEALSLSARFRGVFFSLLSLSVSSPRLLPALCQGFDFCQLWPGPFSYLLSFQLCSAWAPLVY